MTGRATRHSAILIAAFAVTSLLNYVFGVALSWFLSPSQFGVLGVAQSLLLLAALVVGSGFPWAAAQDLARAGPTTSTRHRFRAAWTGNFGLGLLLAGCLWAAYDSGLLELGPAYRQIIPLIALTTVLLAARAAINGAARGSYKFAGVAVNMVSDATLKVGIGLVLVIAGAGVAGVIAGFVLATTATLFHSLWMVKPERLWSGTGWFDPQVLRVTFPLFLGMIGPALMLNLDILGLKILAPASQGDQMAGLYQAVVILARTPVFVAQSLTLVLFSYVAKITASGNHGGAATYLKSAIKVWSRLLLPGALILILAPRAALHLFYPEQYQASILALRIAAAGGLLLALMTLLIGVFQAEGDRGRPAVIASVATGAQIVVLLTLVPRLGVNAAALSLLAAGGIGAIGMIPMIASRFQVNLSNFLQSSARYFYRGGIPVLALTIVLLTLPDGGRLGAFLKLSLAGMLYAIALLGTHLTPSIPRDRPVKHILSQFVNVLMGG
ncbi:MAG TPA: oligosaccharide flippase family protein [Anaerolineales bacterium]|jgi:O-antigen/teichoic acid export membrane protein|nr:oligosaccharide flippase family protein [Anaerolineales bacterium]